MWIVFLLLACFVMVLVIRALWFKVESTNGKSLIASDGDVEAVTQRFSKMIQCPTVSYFEKEKMDWQVFEDFKELLPVLYPKIHAVCDREFHSETGILYLWKGHRSDAVTVLMSHYDVVPANEELWSKPPFSGIVEANTIWGRGTLDTKGTLCGILEAAERLIAQGYIPENDIYFSFSGDEEISGPSAPAIVSYLQKKGIRPALVLDEGGAIVKNILPGVDKPIAVIGTGEKGYMDIELSMKGKGGHSSTPPPNSLVGLLSKAVVRLERRPFKSHLTPPVQELFETLGIHSSFTYRFVFSNLWCFSPLIQWLFGRKGGEMNALIRTTLAVTKAEGSEAFNVVPVKASIGVNLRLLSKDTTDEALKHVKTVINNEDIEVKVIEKREASPISPTNTEAWKKVKTAIQNTWEGTIVTPYLMLAASDSRHFCSISDNVLRFSAMSLSEEERGLIHGNNERIPIKTLMDTIDFYERLMQLL
ncbi:M20/M25/M40 family metallo-hydrolase [Alkaliphilus serpentinus]|uniref:M20/M25/M40 family metallo-hydrolase n=1 Tax=Alkaliphilus serpentinus TaxID=1482731 RepID=A0A833HPF6_9FIRM|nr:M20/M25/M40 family metallo-hydrolase [Alkaliphilus serpentinus]KAB3530692.1 M20/M25/M40 family metallo-hydrolase [Alkaliphilus serpentinus]